jgi:hypothetical protein
VGIRVKDLFTVEAVDAGTSVLEFIAHSRRKIWPPFNLSNTKRMETDIMVTLCREIFVPLCREVLLESRYTTRISQIPELQVGDLGLGSVDTWHGTPDARLRGIEVVWRKDSEEISALVEEIVSDDECSDQSDGTSTAVEGKVLSKEVNLPQAVGTCVVASFAAKALHPEHKALVPTVLIDEKQFRVCLYDCDKDVLLISTSKLLATKGELSRSGIVLLWLVINHRHFLQDLPTTLNKYPALIKSRLEGYGTLEKFTALRSNSVNWNVVQQKWTVASSDLPVGFLSSPPKKRQKKDS